MQSFLQRVDDLREWAEGRSLVEVGVAAHSVRAVPRAWLKDIGAYARYENLPVHIHAGEQVREIEECLSEYGLRPVELLAQTRFLGPSTTIVHATHADEHELDLISAHGSSVCACPTTEGNLGDGFLPALEIRDRSIRLSVARTRRSGRSVRGVAGDRNQRPQDSGAQERPCCQNEISPTPYLLRAGWGHAGLKAGDHADLIEVNLSHPTLSDVNACDLPSALVFGAGSGAVAGTRVAGGRAYG